jgi:hypothetical protein
MTYDVGNPVLGTIINQPDGPDVYNLVVISLKIAETRKTTNIHVYVIYLI